MSAAHKKNLICGDSLQNLAATAQNRCCVFRVQRVLTFQQRRGEAQRSAVPSVLSAKWAFPRWILFSPEVILCSHVDCADVYWGCRLAAAEAYPLSADYCSRYRLHQKVTLLQCGFSLSLALFFFFLVFKWWESFLGFCSLRSSGQAARASWKLLLCLLLSACKNNSRLIYSSSLESWPLLRTHSVLFFKMPN